MAIPSKTLREKKKIHILLKMHSPTNAYLNEYNKKEEHK